MNTKLSNGSFDMVIIFTFVHFSYMREYVKSTSEQVDYYPKKTRTFCFTTIRTSDNWLENRNVRSKTGRLATLRRGALVGVSQGWNLVLE